MQEVFRAILNNNKEDYKNLFLKSKESEQINGFLGDYNLLGPDEKLTFIYHLLEFIIHFKKREKTPIIVSKLLNFKQSIIDQLKMVPYEEKSILLNRFLKYASYFTQQALISPEVAHEFINLFNPIIEQLEKEKRERDRKERRDKIYKALNAHHFDDIKKFMAEGVDMDDLGPPDNTALHYSISTRNYEAIKFLLSIDAKLNTLNESNYTPLFLAILNEDLTSAALLLDKINAGDRKELTEMSAQQLHPLILAIWTKNREMVSLLLDHGVNPNILHIGDYDDENTYPAIIQAKYLRLVDIVQLLQKAIDSKAVKAMKETADLIRFNDELLIIKQIGHSTGLSEVFSIRKPNSIETIDVSTEFAFPIISITELSRLIESYFTSETYRASKTILPEGKKYISELIEGYKDLVRYLNSDGSVTIEDLYERYRSQKIAVIHTAWKDHDISVVLYKDKLIVCNRGVGLDDETQCTNIYHLTEAGKKHITPEFLQSLFPKGPRVSEEVITEQLSKIATSENLIARLPSKPHAYAICSFANAKSATEGIFYVLMMEHQEEQGRITKIKDPSEAETVDIDRLSKDFSRKLYKNFTGFIRDFAILRLCTNIKKKGANTKLYYDLMKTYMVEHIVGKPNVRKRQSQLLRAMKMLLSLDSENRKKMIEELQSENVPVFFYSVIYNVPDLFNLLKEHININSKNENGETALMLATKYGCSKIFENLLAVDSVKKDIDAISSPPEGNSALKYAVLYNRSELVKRLIENGANINLQDGKGDTVLMIALNAMPINNALILFLLENNADPCIPNLKGESPFTLIERKDLDPKIIEWIKDSILKKDVEPIINQYLIAKEAAPASNTESTVPNRVKPKT